MFYSNNAVFMEHDINERNTHSSYQYVKGNCLQSKYCTICNCVHGGLSPLKYLERIESMSFYSSILACADLFWNSQYSWIEKEIRNLCCLTLLVYKHSWQGILKYTLFLNSSLVFVKRGLSRPVTTVGFVWFFLKKHGCPNFTQN